MDLYGDIKAFHEKFELKGNEKPGALEEQLAKFRVGFMCEELAEYCLPEEHHQEFIETMQDEMVQMPLEKQLDALVDLVYVALGTAYLQGFDFNEAWRRVHAANMQKVRTPSAVDSKRGSTYDVIKPPGWTPPDLSDLV